MPCGRRLFPLYAFCAVRLVVLERQWCTAGRAVARGETPANASIVISRATRQDPCYFGAMGVLYCTRLDVKAARQRGEQPASMPLKIREVAGDCIKRRTSVHCIVEEESTARRRTAHRTWRRNLYTLLRSSATNVTPRSVTSLLSSVRTSFGTRPTLSHDGGTTSACHRPRMHTVLAPVHRTLRSAKHLKLVSVQTPRIFHFCCLFARARLRFFCFIAVPDGNEPGERDPMLPLSMTRGCGVQVGLLV